MLWPILTALVMQPFAMAQDLDLQAVKKLDTDLKINEARDPLPLTKNKYRPPYKTTHLSSILESGTEHGHVQAGRYLIRLSDEKAVALTESFFGKFYKLQDEQGFKYFQSNDGTCVYKIKTEYFHSVEPELALYELPLRYTPAPVNILKSDVDKKLTLRPELTARVGSVHGAFMKDLFNDPNANTGVSNQYGIHVATDWKLPIKAGLVFNYEKASYNLRGGGNVHYSAASFGPQFKSKNFELFDQALRLQTQFRVSPFAQATAQTTQGDIAFKFNSADLLVGLEHPIKNRLGEFVLGVFYQSQWLSLKDQPEIVSVNASNEANSSIGLSFAQVFK